MSAPAQFQSDFAHALFAQGEPLPTSAIARLVSQPAFAVYRNTVYKGCIDALQSNFPAVTRLVGESWFRSFAAEYVAAHPPTDARLVDYGKSFPGFLELREAAHGLPYLDDVATLDRFWTESHVAGDADSDSSFLSRLSPDELGTVRVAAHPAARWRWFAGEPIFTIWSRNRAAGEAAVGEMGWHGEGALVTRPADSVVWAQATQAQCLFMDACAIAGGARLLDAAAAALDARPGTDVATLLAGLLQAGALVFPARPAKGRAA